MNLDYEKYLEINIKKFSFEETISKKFFFKNLNCTFSNKKINFVTGKNGIGKSTLFKILQNSINDIFIDGEIYFDENNFSLKEKKDLLFLSNLVGLVNQNYNSMLAEDYTILENLKACSLEKYPGFSFFKKEKFYNLDILHEAKIELNKLVKNLSGGQKQILAITMILQKNLKIILLDEPTAALDDANSEFFFKFIKKIIEKENIYFVCICHDKELIKKYSDGFYHEIIKNSNNERFIIKKEA